MKLLLVVLLAGCPNPVPVKPCPPPPPASQCSPATFPPLVSGWLATVPLPAPNDDVTTLLATWAATNCSKENTPTP